jgi:GTP-binding protein HflX
MPREKAYLIIVLIRGKPRHILAESFEEMKELTESAGGYIVGSTQVVLPHPSPSHFIREGKLLEVRDQARQLGAHLLIFNLELTPVQARNIEAFVGIRAVDRTGLILDIFARRAQSREGRMQVELAQLNYLLPRLVGHGVIMSRLGGGIGTRGPGEQKLEVDRRKIRERIQRVKNDLTKLERHRELLRQSRRQRKFIQIAIVGYTNAGKSTLLNALTGAGTYVEDKLFATLDPKTRVQTVNSNRSILFTDTVGFLRDLPHGLVEAFHATLEEVVTADILVHVLDVSHPRCSEQKKVVEGVLKDMKADGKPVVLALNKADLLREDEKRRIHEMYSEGILISAKNKAGLHGLLAKLDSVIPHKNFQNVTP